MAASNMKIQNSCSSSDPSIQNSDGSCNDHCTKTDSLTCLIVGKTGAGKSSLINSVFGAYLAEESMGVCGTEMPNGCKEDYKKKITITKDVDGGFKSDVELTLIDTRGSADPSMSPREKSELLTVYKSVEIHLILVCINITERIDDSTIAGIVELQKIFKKRFWEHSIILFTFSNKLEEKLKEKKNNDEIKELVTKEGKKAMELIKKKLSKPLISELPCVHVGYKNFTDLSTSENWQKKLLDLCVERCPRNKAAAMNFVARKLTCTSAGLIGVTTLGGTIIGATIGSLVIPIPGVGTGVGAGIGAGVGLGCGIAVGSGMSAGIVAVHVHQQKNSPTTEDENVNVDDFVISEKEDYLVIEKDPKNADKD